MLRFAEADTDFGNLHSEFCIRLCAFNTALARKGLAVFNRFAHSAGPESFMQWCDGSVARWCNDAMEQWSHAMEQWSHGAMEQ